MTRTLQLLVGEKHRKSLEEKYNKKSKLDGEDLILNVESKNVIDDIDHEVELVEQVYIVLGNYLYRKCSLSKIPLAFENVMFCFYKFECGFKAIKNTPFILYIRYLLLIKYNPQIIILSNYPENKKR